MVLLARTKGVWLGIKLPAIGIVSHIGGRYCVEVSTVNRSFGGMWRFSEWF